MNDSVLSASSDAEIHRLLDDLAWEDVEAVAEEDTGIKKHLRKCHTCLDREKKVTDGRLASMEARKRQMILSAAERLASLFRQEYKA
jgi:hypothetical protein